VLPRLLNLQQTTAVQLSLAIEHDLARAGLYFMKRW